MFSGFYGVHMRASESKLMHGKSVEKNEYLTIFFPYFKNRALRVAGICVV